MMKQTLVLALAAITLAACSHRGGTAELPPIIENRPAPIPDVKATPMELRDVNWRVYTADELAQEAERARASGEPVVYYVLVKPDFEVLAMNLSEMRRYIEDQSAINDTLIAAIKINESPNRGLPAQ